MVIGSHCGISAKKRKTDDENPVQSGKTLLSGRRAEGAALYSINFGMIKAPKWCWPHGVLAARGAGRTGCWPQGAYYTGELWGGVAG